MAKRAVRCRSCSASKALPIIIVFALLLALFMYTAPTVFLRPFIYTTFLSTLPPLVLLAAGLTFVIGAGEIDLCFPAIIAFSGFVFAVLFKEYDLGWIAVVAGARLRRPRRLRQRRARRQDRHPLVHGDAGDAILLGRHGDGAVRRQVLRAARGRGRARSGNGSSAGPFAGTASIVLARASCRCRRCGRPSSSVFLWFILTRHRFGEHMLFIGDSNEVSRVVGIDVDREKIKLFTLMGFLAACAAIMLTLENKNFFGNQGQGYLLTAIASVLIGGTSIFGGRATDHRHGVRLLHHRHDRGRPGGERAHRRLGAHGPGPDLPHRHHLLSLCRRAATQSGVLRAIFGRFRKVSAGARSAE